MKELNNILIGTSRGSLFRYIGKALSSQPIFQNILCNHEREPGYSQMGNQLEILHDRLDNLMTAKTPNGRKLYSLADKILICRVKFCTQESEEGFKSVNSLNKTGVMSANCFGSRPCCSSMDIKQNSF